MAFCTNCGSNIGNDAKFCPACGKAATGATMGADNYTGSNQKTYNSGNIGSANEILKNIIDTADYTSEFDPQDINANKLLSLLAYVGILFIIPLVAAPNSKYARFHANQGLILFIPSVLIGVISVVASVLSEFFGFFIIINIGSSVLGFAITAFTLFGIYNAVLGKAKELPFIGKFRIIK